MPTELTTPSGNITSSTAPSSFTTEPSTHTSPVFFTYTGNGRTGTPLFESDWSYWKIAFSTNWNGQFTVELKTGKTGHIVVDQVVRADEEYRSCVIGYTGSPFFVVLAAPEVGQWTIWVEPDPYYY